MLVAVRTILMLACVTLTMHVTVALVSFEIMDVVPFAFYVVHSCV